jgi:hypothetical protein
MTKRLDSKDLLILQLLYNQDYDPSSRTKPNLSITEIRDAIPGVRSVATIHNRLSNLENQGYVVQPGYKQPRSRRITQHGINELKREVPQI